MPQSRNAARRVPRVAALVAAAALAFTLATSASADTPPGRGPAPAPSPTEAPTMGDCAVLHVQLHGNQPATRTCLTQMPDSGGTGRSARTSTTATLTCTSATLRLHEHPNYGGRLLCVTGTGILDLEDYFWTEYWGPFGWPRTWDDRLSSFETGQYHVNFYEHPNFGGQRLRYASFQSRAAMPSGWDNRVSSVCIWSTGNTCP